MGYTKEQIEAAVKAKGYVWFEDENNKGMTLTSLVLEIRLQVKKLLTYLMML